MGGNNVSSQQPSLGTTQVPSMGGTNILQNMPPYGESGHSSFPFPRANYSPSGPYGTANVPFLGGVNPPLQGAYMMPMGNLYLPGGHPSMVNPYKGSYHYPPN